MSEEQGQGVALTTVYAQPDASWRSAPHGSRKLHGSWWCWVLLGAGWVSTAVLAGVVLRLLQRDGGNSPLPSQGTGCSWEPYPTNTSRCDTPESRCSLDCFRLQLRERLCERGSHHTAGSCWLCPVGWWPFGAQCYWASPKSGTWEVAAANCSEQGSRLAVLESVEEKHFIQEMIQRGSGAWIGLKQPGGQSWTWWDGSPLQEDWYPLHSETGDACAAVGMGELRSHMCSTPLRWVCQREATGI